MTPHVLAFANQKGGSGKTTSAVNVAAALGELGKRVLLMDLDSQASASRWYGIPNGGPGLYVTLTEDGELLELVHKTEFPGVDIVPGSAWLVGLDKAMAGEIAPETKLKALIEQLPARWDFVLLDCPPSLGLMSVSALTAAGAVVVPVEASVLALAGLAALTKTVDTVRERLNHDLKIAAILVCRVDLRTNLAQDVLDRLRERFGDLVMQTTIREGVRLRECPSFRAPITTYAPTSHAAEDYRSAAAELLQRLKGK